MKKNQTKSNFNSNHVADQLWHSAHAPLATTHTHTRTRVGLLEKLAELMKNQKTRSQCAAQCHTPRIDRPADW